MGKSIEELHRILGWGAYNYVLGAFDGDRLVGIVGLRRERGRKIHNSAVLWGVYVAMLYRGRGIAKSLVGAILDVARGMAEVTQVKLSVNTKNAPARRIYEATGFRSYGAERNALRFGEASYDEELMMLPLR